MNGKLLLGLKKLKKTKAVGFLLQIFYPKQGDINPEYISFRNIAGS